MSHSEHIIKLSKSYADDDRSDVNEGVYEVRRDGEYLGDVSRDDSFHTGEWGRWQIGRRMFLTRSDAIAWLCERRDLVGGPGPVGAGWYGL
jgi:hypothetical protein